MKQNDWIVATLNNPEFTAADFKNIQNLSLDNTQLLSKDEYLKSQFIINNNAFKNSDGTFDKDKFDSFYNKQAQKFQTFQQDSSIDNYTYGFWDTANVGKPNISKPKIGIDLVLNPEHISKGVVGQGMQGEREWSDMELAQRQKIFDISSKKEKDYSANDASLFSNPFRWFEELVSEPLVLATYDKDESSINPITGQMEQHKKGEKKINGAGEYYLETLGGRSVIGKQFLSMGDIITSDTSSINKYDFFDSDGLEKSTAGVIAKNLAAVAPMAFLGPVGTTIYGGAYVVREIAKAMPMLYQMSTSLFDNTNDSKLLNNIAGWGNKLTGGTSEYAKQNTFSFENFGNLISDVALQWGQQKVIANSIAKLGNSGKKVLNAAEGKAMYEFQNQAKSIINKAEREEIGQDVIQNLFQYVGAVSVPELEGVIKSGAWKNTFIGQASLKKFLPEAEKAYAKRVRLGQDMSLAYMAIVSNTDVYEQALEHGATKKEAAMLALGSTVGMFSVDKYLGLGEMFFDDPDAVARREFKRVLGEESNNLISNIKNLANTPESKKSYLDLFKGGIKIAKNTVNKYQGKVKDRSLTLLGKSIGEGLEEVSEELVTDISKSLYEIAADFGYASTKDVGAWDNANERYLMSFFGGAIGGAMFGGIEAFRNPTSAFDKNSKKELLYLIKEGKTQDILKELDILHDKGQLGDKNLSVDTTQETDQRVFITADEKHKSQNDFIYDVMKSSILQMDSIINGNQLNISDDQLFEKMVLSDPKFLQLSSLLKDKSYITGYYEKYQNLIQDFYNNEKDIQDLNNSVSDPAKRKEEEYINKLNDLVQKREQLKQEIDDFKNGKYSLEYTEKMLFAMNPEISGKFLSMAFDQWLTNNYNKKVGDLSESELETYEKEWDNYNKTNRKLDFEEAFKLYKETSKKINPILQELSKTEDVKSWEKIADQLEKDFPLLKLKTPYHITQEELGDVSELSEEEINDRRKELADQYNSENLSKFIQLFADNNSIIDSSTYRRLIASLTDRRKDIVTNNILGRIKFINTDSSIESKLNQALGKLNEDLNNIDDIKEEVHQIAFESVKSSIQFGNAEIDMGDNFEMSNGYLTFLDLLNIIDDSEFKGTIINEENLDDIFQGALSDNEQLIQDLINAHNYELQEETINQANEIKESYNLNPEKSFTGNGLENAVIISQDTVNNIINQLSEESNKNFDQNIDQVINDLKSNPMYKALTDVKKKLTLNQNPTLKVIKAISSKLGDNFSDIEDTLQSIYEQYERLDNIQDYLLSDEQLQALEKAQQYIDIAEGFVNASSYDNNYFHIMPFYKTINEFTKSHSNQLENTEELPELDKDVANVILQSLNNYRKEINTWIQSSKENSLNKIREFKEFDKKFKNIKKEFLRGNINALEDLGTGLDLIDWDSPNAVFEAEKLIYSNFIKYKKSPKELIQIFKKIIPEFESIKSQLTTDLNGQIENLTSYDKFTYLSSILAVDPVDFNIYYKDFVENKSTTQDGQIIAPLTHQEHVIKISYAQQANPKFINSLLQEITKELNFNRSILWNASIITGLGGAGKSQVVARALSTTNNIWYSGPSNSQIENLLKINPNAKGISKEDLFNEILESGEYNKVIQEINPETKNKGEKVNYNITHTGDYITLKNIKYKKLETVPEKLIIDEITLFSSAEIQMLGEWAKLNNVKLIFLGDENQNGNQEAGYNIDPNYLFAFRTPRLSISLRQANYWKYLNQKPLEKMLDELRTADDKKAETLYQQYITGDFKEYQLHYYLENGTFTGDMLSNTLTNEQIGLLNGNIGYIGEETDEIYQKLKNSGKNVSKALSPKDVQGQEFDYIIVNKDWKFDSPNRKGSNEFKLFQYMQDLYTMITRSRKGSIIIDNGLSENIRGNKQENYTTDAITLNPQSISEFTKTKLDELNSMDLTPRNLTQEEKQEKTSQEPLEKDMPIEVPQAPIEIGQQFNSTEQEKEIQESESINEEPISENPYTAYSNISFTGLVTQERNGNKVWIKSGLLRDLDILLDDDTQKQFHTSQRKSELATSQDQKEYSTYLMQLKSYLHFGGNFNQLPNIIKNIFKESDFNNIEYYIVSEDQDNTKHSILRIQQGLNEENNSFISDSKGIPQVISIQARIKSSKTGKTYTLTIGAVESLDGSKKSKQILINQLSRQHKDWNESQLSAEADRIINSYDANIKNIVEQKERRINSPYYTKTTGLRSANNGKYRLVDLDGNSTYENATLGYVSSPVYTIVDSESLKSLGIKPSLLGKPIMYVSSNTNLNPNDLASIYASQKSDLSSSTPEVRMLVLDSEGVSFESLLKEGYSKKYYEISTSPKKTFKLPFVSLPMAVRMYLGLWNFRANLINFNNQLNELLKEHTSQEIDEISQLDTNLYNQARGNSYINEEEYRNWIQQNQPKETYDKLKILWDFNDLLKTNGVREFRLGFSSKTGTYIRRIDNNTNGIYINRELAQNYENTLNVLFTNIIDKIIPPISQNDFKTFIDKKATQEQWEQLEKSWVENIKNGVSLDIVTSEGTIKHNFGASDSIRMLPMILKQLNLRYLERGYVGIQEFDEKVANGKRAIKLGEDSLNYVQIFETLGTQINTDEDWIHQDSEYIPGTEPYFIRDGQKYGIIDKRLVNLFNLAFHGVPATREFNNLNVKGQLKASDALFPYGFFVDTFISDQHDGKINKEVLTNKMFYSTDKVPTGPIVRFSFNEYIPETSSNVFQSNNSIEAKIKEINQILGTNFQLFLDEEELQEQIEETLSQNIENLFDGTQHDDILNTLVDYSSGNFVTLGQKLFGQKQITSIRQLDNQYEITLDGKTYYLQRGSKRGTYSIKEVAPTISSIEKQGSTLEEIGNYIISKLGLDEEDSKIFKEIYIKNNGSAILTRNDLKDNKILNQLQQELDIDPKNIVNIVNSLQEANNGTCTLPIK